METYTEVARQLFVSRVKRIYASGLREFLQRGPANPFLTLVDRILDGLEPADEVRIAAAVGSLSELVGLETHPGEARALYADAGDWAYRYFNVVAAEPSRELLAEIINHLGNRNRKNPMSEGFQTEIRNAIARLVLADPNPEG